MEKESGKIQMQVSRVYEQPPDAISLYSDMVQILATGHEVVMQFYETIPGTPGPDGQIQLVKTRLRATITVSKAHASTIGSLLLKQIQAEAAQAGAKIEGAQP
ncbi:MAG: hypothetical protein KGJ40_02040 [candidate division NC10 bacterium]|nr:hypothetical protein [candidate division NC10 bacterium]